MTYRETKFASYTSTFEQKSASSSSSSSNMLTSQTATNDKCARCTYPIYPLELMGSIMGKKYHRACFKCAVCDRQLDLKTFQTNQIDLNDTQIYCASHAPRNGKGAITFNSSSRSNSPSVQTRPNLNKSKSQENLDYRNSPIRISPTVNDANRNVKSKDDLRVITDDDYSTVITIPVIIKSEVTPPKPSTNGKLNEMGTKLVELSKSNIDLKLPEEDMRQRDSRQNETSKPIVTFGSDSVSPISIMSNDTSSHVTSPTNENSLHQTYEFLMEPHEIDQLLKDLESNQQPAYLMNLDRMNSNSSNNQVSNVVLDSVLDKGVVIDKLPANNTTVSSSTYNNTSQSSYTSSSHTREQSSTTRVENHSVSTHAEGVYHTTNSNISNKIQYFIEQNAAKQQQQQQFDFNRQISSGSVNSRPDRQTSLDDSNTTNKKYVSVFIPPIKDTPNKPEMLIIKSDGTPSNEKYVEVIHTPTSDYSKPPFVHSVSEHSLKPNENTIDPNITVRPVPIQNPETTILGENHGLGAIKLTVYYDELRHRLSITIHQAQNLKNLEKNKKAVSDPYCRIYLLPDDKQKTLKRKTRVVKDNLNPKWEETFDYLMSYDAAVSKDLIVNLKDERGLFQKAEDCFMGEVLLRLKDIGIQNQYTRWIYLQPLNAVSRLLLSSGIRPYS